VEKDAQSKNIEGLAKEHSGSSMSTTNHVKTRNAKLKHEHPEVKNLRKGRR
jgi:hypothetical protein